MNRRPSQSRSRFDAFSYSHGRHFSASSPDASFFETKKRRSPGRRLLLALLAAICALLLGNAVANCFVVIRRERVPITGIGEEFSGFTILQISDLKGAQFGNGQRRLIARLEREHYDVVVLTGDLVSALGNPQPLYDLIDALRGIRGSVPIYFIPGDCDPEPISMRYAAGGSPFAPWVLGAQQRGARMLSWPESIDRGGRRLRLTTSGSLGIDLETMQGQYERRYLNALDGGDENEIELAKYHLQVQEKTRQARAQMREEDVCVTLTHVPPDPEEIEGATSASLLAQVNLILCGHELGGLLRLPWLGPVFLPSQRLPRYGLFPGEGVGGGLTRIRSTWVYESCGLGASDARYPLFFFRLFNPPSVSLISFEPSAL